MSDERDSQSVETITTQETVEELVEKDVISESELPEYEDRVAMSQMDTGSANKTSFGENIRDKLHYSTH